ncbi:MAG: hypothetical protein E7311_02030 [Clostridiales bacterium]|nr:hypothetical protein [Clostridiales bacterium]
MKKGNILIVIPMLMILMGSVIYTGAKTPKQNRSAIFYNDISILQEAVTLQALTNYVESQQMQNYEKDKYDGILSQQQVIGENINNQLGNSVVLYKFEQNPEIDAGNIDFTQFCADKETGTVYHIKGVVIKENGKKTVIYNKNTKSTVNIPSTAIDISEY